MTTCCKNSITSCEGFKFDISTCNHQLLMNQFICLIHPRFVSAYYSLLNQTLSWSLVFNLAFNQVIIISWYSLSSIYPSIVPFLIVPFLTNEQCGAERMLVLAGKRMLLLSRRQLTSLTGIRHWTTMIWKTSCYFQ